MTFTVQQSPWVTLRKGDPSFQLQGQYTMATRAGFEITSRCPKKYADIITQAYKQGWLTAVAVVPRDDPTYMWATLKQ